MGIKGKLCKHTIALTYDRDPEFPIDPRLRAKKLHSRKRGVCRPAKVKEALNKSPAKNVIENVDNIETGEEQMEICNLEQNRVSILKKFYEVNYHKQPHIS